MIFYFEKFIVNNYHGKTHYFSRPKYQSDVKMIINYINKICIQLHGNVTKQNVYNRNI